MEQPESAASGAEVQEATPSVEAMSFAEFERLVDGKEVVSETQLPSTPAGETQKKEPDAPAESAESPSEEAPSEEAPKKGTAQDRIGELTRNWRSAERERDDLRRQLDEAKNPQKKQSEQAQTAAPDADAPDPENAEKYPYGEIDPKYIRDLARHETKLANREIREEEAAAAQQREFQQQTTKMIDSGKQKYPDFHDKVFGGAEREDYPLSATVGELLVQSDTGADIAYHLATNPEEAARIYAMTPVDQARAFGRLEAKFSATETAAPGKTGKEPPPRNVPAAPEPLQPARGANGRFQPSPDGPMDFSEFERFVDSQPQR